LAGAIIWVGGAPAQKTGPLQIVSSIGEVDWGAAFGSLFASHIWWGNWSFLAVRSWIYHVFEYGALLIVVGVVLRVVRNYRGRKAQAHPVQLPHLGVVFALYAGFLAAIAYHVLMTFLDFGLGASAGWYVYAVVLPEAILVIAGLSAFKMAKHLIVATIVAFSVLEIYATHWILIPYYTGLIGHVAGSLQSFYINQLSTIGFSQLLARLETNRPFFVNGAVLVGLWISYLVALAGLVYVSFFSRDFSDVKQKEGPSTIAGG
jgi:hypothetical protein